jgi:hypothetical protein
MRRASALLLSLLLALAGLVPPASAGDARGLPATLSGTGLYLPGSTTEVRADVLAFSPQYPLWSDGATKRRWIHLPPGASIDARNPDAWEFPRGTRLWKEFSHGRALETRYLERGADGAWRFGSYVWNAAGTEAVLAPADGMRVAAARAPGGRYPIPAENDCRACHESGPSPVLGFGALQLSPDRDPLAPHAEHAADALDLRELVARGLLVNLPPELLVDPPRVAAANPVERAALGYLHGNCGNCHNQEGPLAVLEMTLAQRLSAPRLPGPVLRSVVGVDSDFRAGTPRIAPGHAADSLLVQRMNSRDPLQQMPPLGTGLADDEAVALLARWIAGLSTPVPVTKEESWTR